MLTLYGIHPVLEALKKRPRAFHRLFLSRESGREDFTQIVSLARAAKINTALVTIKELAQMCRSEQHQGVVAEVEPLPLLDHRGCDLSLERQRRQGAVSHP